MSKAASVTDRVDSALSRLESMVDERLRLEREHSDAPPLGSPRSKANMKS